MNKRTFKNLVEKINNGTATDEELAAYNALMNRATDGGEGWNEKRFGKEGEFENSLLADINSQIDYRKTKVTKLWPRIAAAASILIAFGVGGYFILHKQTPAQVAQHQMQDVAPGHNRATLTLANGQKIILTKGLHGQLAIQGHTIIQAGGNHIAYNNSSKEESVSYNTLATARGEQSPYPLVLADGTKVWLNAASSITFPTAFNGKDREVKVTGEAYFEVAHNAAHPFRVNANGIVTEDIGTAFDVNAYNDEPVIKTTLLEGSVSLTKGDNHIVLMPGQAGVASSNSNKIKALKVNTEEAVAWRKGYFFFNNDEDIQSVMRKIARWYNVEVVYPQTGPPAETFGGTASRYSNVSQVLKALETTSDVRFKIEGRKIYVFNK